MNLDGIEHVCNVGKGSYGSAELMFNKKKSDFSVFKFVDNKLDTSDEILNHLYVSEHKNIINLESFGTYKNFHYIELEYAENGDLFKFLKHNGRQSENSAKFFIKHIINAIDYCHNRGIIHCDIKLENILLGKNNIPKLADFGYSKYQYIPKKMLGTIQYMAPEIFISDYEIDHKIDIFACGVCLYLLLFAKYPFQGIDNYETIENILKNNYTIDYDIISIECADLIKQLLEPIPEERISIEKIKEHSWFKIMIERC